MKRRQNIEYKPEGKWLGRSLDNYKSIHAPTAKAQGCSAELEAAQTLTKARKVLFGYKRGNVR